MMSAHPDGHRPMDLLERGRHLETLTACLGEVAAGAGRLVFVSGEAGIGKTTLVRRFAEDAHDRAHIAFASCDALSTPGPLGAPRDGRRTTPFAVK